MCRNRCTGVRAVDLGGLEAGLVDALERREVDHGDESELTPQRHQHDHEHRLVGVLEPALLRQAEHPEDVVDHADLGVEHEVGQQPGHRGGGDVRDEDRRAVETDEPDLPVQRDGQQQAADDRGGHEDGGVEQGVERRGDQVGVATHPLEVVGADEARLAEAVPLLQGEQAGPGRRKEPEPDDDHHGGGDEGDRPGQGFSYDDVGAATRFSHVQRRRHHCSRPRGTARPSGSGDGACPGPGPRSRASSRATRCANTELGQRIPLPHPDPSTGHGHVSRQARRARPRAW